jgi:hypothetical protein
MSGQAKSTKVAPYDLEAEESLLGAMIVSPSAIPVAIGLVAEDDFYRDTNGLVFGAIGAIHERGDPVDVVTLGTELDCRGLLERVGGKAYLHTLVDVCPAAANVRRYAEIVAGLAGDRRARTALLQALEAFDGTSANVDRVAAARAAAEKLLATCDKHTATLVLPVVRACDLAATMPEEMAGLLVGYVFFGAITLLVAKVKAGKTTLLLMLVAAVLHGQPFLDRPTSKATVLLYTEEGKNTVLAALRRAGLQDEPDLHIFFKQDTRGRSFIEVMASIINYGRQVAGDGPVFLIVDTIASAGRPVDDDENSTSWAQAVVDAVRPATELGWAALLTQHMRKSAGDIEDSARGSSALPGAVDVVVALSRANTAGHSGRRELEAVGRFDGIPPKLVIELNDGIYHALGDESAVEQAACRERLLDLLPSLREDALTEAEILRRLDTNAKRSTVKRTLDRLVTEGVVGKDHNTGMANGRSWGFWLLSSKTEGLDKAMFRATGLDNDIRGSQDPDELSRVNVLENTQQSDDGDGARDGGPDTRRWTLAEGGEAL